MSGIAPLGPGSIPSADSPQYRSNGTGRSAGSAATPYERGDDSVELSPTARRLLLLDRVLHDPPVRDDLIDRVRQEIASGRYDTAEKIDRVVDEIWNDYFGDDSTTES